MAISRRQFVRGAAVSAGFLGLSRYLGAQGAGTAPGIGPGLQPYLGEIEGYGPLVADPRRILDLPKGFAYRILSRTGDPMSDGFRVPGLPDGMAAFPGPNGRVIVVRNHEMVLDRTFDGPFGLENELFARVDRKYVYDAGRGRPHLGGTTTIVYDPAAGRVERQFLSLAGTLRNCAGGPTPWGSWITCEESVDTAGEVNEKNHGYAFEVPATAEPGLTLPVPLRGLGRFYREAVAVEPRTSIVYQTEDRADGLIYRFVPRTPRVLTGPGRLQVLAVRGAKGLDTRNWAETAAPNLPVGQALAVQWLDISDVEAPRDDLRQRGVALGAAVFARGEGMWYGRGEVYFACTNGGLSQRGQIFRYVPSPSEGTPAEEQSPGRLQLYVEPNNSALLESPDNVCVAPWGDLVVCEDNAAPPPAVAQYFQLNYMRGITLDGKLYTLGRNRYFGNSELAGACFAPNAPVMFVNIQTPGITLAITGPWNALDTGRPRG
jgi:secreted PhoX family phosphatase